MNRILTLLDAPRRGHGLLSALDREVEDTRRETASAAVLALEIRNSALRFLEHCTRVTRLVERLAIEMRVDGEDFSTLRHAAQLHEIGMVAVPPELIEKPAPLTPRELDRVRAQAWIGAEIVRATHDARTARLVKHQYTDFAELRRLFGAGSRDLLLAGVLRVADAFDAMTHPRPYQRNLPDAHRAEVFRGGAGTRFHPEAVDTLFQVRGELA